MEIQTEIARTPKHSRCRKWLKNHEDAMVTFVWVQLTLQLVDWVLPPAVCVDPELPDPLSDEQTHAFSLSEASGLNIFACAILKFHLSDFE